MRYFISCLVILGIVSVGLVYSEEFISYGPRVQGMGGAGVALSDGPSAHYYNPAATYKNKEIGLYIPFGFNLSLEGGIMESVDTLSTIGGDIDWGVVMDNVINNTWNPVTDAKLIGNVMNFFSIADSELSKKGQGVFVSVYGINVADALEKKVKPAPVLLIRGLTVSINSFGYAAIDPVADETNLSMGNTISGTIGAGGQLPSPVPRLSNTAFANELASQPLWQTSVENEGNDPQQQAERFVQLAEYGGADTFDPVIQQSLIQIARILALDPTKTIDKNTSGIIMNTLSIDEIAVSYSKEVLPAGLLSVGGTLKMMEAQSNRNVINYKSLESGEETIESIGAKGRSKTSSAFGLDVGGLCSFTKILRGGLVIKNLNSPKFKYAGGGDIELEPQMRAGVALDLSTKLVGFILTADYDVTKNKSVVLDGYESQMFGAGAELMLGLGFLRIRAGMSQNMASKFGEKVLTAGLGIRLLLLSIEVSGAMTPETVVVESGGESKMPQRMAVSAAVAMKF
jgi:hypothetical protein